MTDRPSIPQRVAVEPLGPLLFRGSVNPSPLTRTYGGEVAGQAVMAAGRTVDPARAIHSAHMHFLLPGDPTTAVDFSVEVVRDGGSFSSRRVVASQHERDIFAMTASFQRPEEGLEHQVAVPDAPTPEETLPAETMFADEPQHLAWLHGMADVADVEVRFPEVPTRVAADRGDVAEPRQRAWLRARRPVGESHLDQAAALAFVSDLLLLSVAVAPHRTHFQSGRLQFATIDHTVWFHAPLAVDEWFLYEQESRWVGGGRALCRGEIFDAGGRLCASTTQEGLLRRRTDA